MDRLVTYFVILLALTVILLSPLLGSYKDVAIGTASSLIAAIVFAKVYQSRFESFIISQSRSIIEDALADSAKNVSANVLSVLSQHTSDLGHRFRTYLPIRVWPASDSPHDQFNDIVNANASRSTRYRYKGDRGLFFAHRLSVLSAAGILPSNCRIEVLICDPREQSSLECCSRNRINRSKTKDLTELTDKLKNEIFATVYGLYEVKSSCHISIGFTKDVPLFRFELLDNAIFVSILTSLQDGHFAETAQYSNDSDYYQYYSRQFENEFACSQSSGLLVLSSIPSTSVLMNKLSVMGCTLAESDLRSILDKYKKNLK